MYWLQYTRARQIFHVIFTNASKSNTHCATAFYIPQLNATKQQHILFPHTSVYSAELIAILLASRSLQRLYPPTYSRAIVISDSLSAIKSIAHPSNKRKTPPLILYKRNILQYLLHFHNCEINFTWVPGRSGIPENELVDQLAKSATSTAPVSYTHLTLPTIYSV